MTAADKSNEVSMVAADLILVVPMINPFFVNRYM